MDSGLSATTSCSFGGSTSSRATARPPPSTGSPHHPVGHEPVAQTQLAWWPPLPRGAPVGDEDLTGARCRIPGMPAGHDLVDTHPKQFPAHILAAGTHH
ncbi:hypothetical protein AB0O75_07360 [Streptomyces sp. NPDC088921]|uniref:hypothetical protein n=1 Tax=unclassified Streptomyces TaxID=2593676 RepID=UPI00341995A7